MFFNLCSEAQGEIRNWFSSHLKERKDGLGERHALFSGRWKVSLAGVNHLFCWPLKKTAKPNRFPPLCEQLSFLLTIFLCLFFNLCNSVTFSSFFFFCFSFCSVSRFFVFFIPHHHSIWAVKIQRSGRQLPWDSWASNPCSLHTNHHHNSYLPDHCRGPALTFPKAPPPHSPRNVPHFLSLVFIRFPSPHASVPNSLHLWFMRVACFPLSLSVLCTNNVSFLAPGLSFSVVI